MKRTWSLLCVLACAAPVLAQDVPVDPLWPHEVQENIRLRKELSTLRSELQRTRADLLRSGRELKALQATLGAREAELKRLRAARSTKPAPKPVLKPTAKRVTTTKRHEAKAPRRIKRIARAKRPAKPLARSPKHLKRWPKARTTPKAKTDELPALISSNDETYTVPMASRSDADRTRARHLIASKVLDQLLGSKTAAAVPAAKRQAVYQELVEAYRQERVRKTRRGKLLLRATVNLGEARSVVLDELGVAGQFQRSPFIVISGLRGPGKSLAATAGSAFGDALTQHRFRRLSSSAPRSAAPLVCSIRGKIMFTRMPAHSAQAGSYRGYLRCQGVVARVYDRNTQTVLAEFTVSSSSKKRDAFEATLNKLHQPWVGQHESVSHAAERYAQFIGRAAATRVAQSFLATYCRARLDVSPKSQPVTRPIARSGRRVLRAAPRSRRSRHPLPSDYYELRFVGFDYDEVDQLVRALERVRGFDNWVERGAMGNLHAYECTFRGTFIVRRLHTVLEDAELDGRVRKRGAKISITKR